jgi:hypothetical protein
VCQALVKRNDLLFFSLEGKHIQTVKAMCAEGDTTNIILASTKDTIYVHG